VSSHQRSSPSSPARTTADPAPASGIAGPTCTTTPVKLCVTLPANGRDASTARDASSIWLASSSVSNLAATSFATDGGDTPSIRAAVRWLTPRVRAHHNAAMNAARPQPRRGSHGPQVGRKARTSAREPAWMPVTAYKWLAPGQCLRCGPTGTPRLRDVTAVLPARIPTTLIRSRPLRARAPPSLILRLSAMSGPYAAQRFI
jgi:hypothetical protein